MERGWALLAGGRKEGRKGGRREGGRTLRVYIYERVDTGRLPLLYTEQHLQEDALLSALLVVFISAASRPPILHPPPPAPRVTCLLFVSSPIPFSLFLPLGSSLFREEKVLSQYL